MAEKRDNPQWADTEEVASLSVVDRVLVVTLTRDLTTPVLERLRALVLRKAQQARAIGTVFDATNLPLMDAQEFRSLRQTASMLRLLGSRPVLAGVPPTVAELLAVLGADTEGFDATVASVQDGVRFLHRKGTQKARLR
jgi:anti-anti-sigma regulatory factor